MFVKKLCAAAVAAVMSVSAVYVASAAEYAPYIRYITEEGGAEILDGTGYESHIYEPSTGTLAFTEDTTLFGNDYNIDGYCGSAIIPSEHNTDLTIELLNRAYGRLDSRNIQKRRYADRKRSRYAHGDVVGRNIGKCRAYGLQRCGYSNN